MTVSHSGPVERAWTSRTANAGLFECTDPSRGSLQIAAAARRKDLR
jgi:hypothetical protein